MDTGEQIRRQNNNHKREGGGGGGGIGVLVYPLHVLRHHLEVF